MENDRDSKNGLIAGLKQAARGPSRTKTARLREIFDEVEAAKESGLHLKTIVDVLSKRGLEFNLATFVNTRQRIKNERKQQPASPVTAPAAPAAPAAPNSGEIDYMALAAGLKTETTNNGFMKMPGEPEVQTGKAGAKTK